MQGDGLPDHLVYLNLAVHVPIIDQPCVVAAGQAFEATDVRDPCACLVANT
jgi:hypothetical protein